MDGERMTEANVAVVARMLDALKWAETFVLGRLPDYNTQSQAEVDDYLGELGQCLYDAIRDGAMLIGSHERPSEDLISRMPANRFRVRPRAALRPDHAEKGR